MDLPAVKRAYKKKYDVTLSQEIDKHYNKDLAAMLQQVVGKANDTTKVSGDILFKITVIQFV